MLKKIKPILIIHSSCVNFKFKTASNSFISFFKDDHSSYTSSSSSIVENKLLANSTDLLTIYLFLDPLVKHFENNSNLSWNYDNDNFNVLNKSDILITDFSGIIFDFSLLFDRPLIYADTKFDTLPYDADWIEEPMWKFRVLPKLGIKLEEDSFYNIKNIITTAIDSKEMEESRKEVREQAWPNRGLAAKIAVDYLIKKGKQ